MSKKVVTTKDALYALEYGGEKLLKTHVAGKASEWSLSKTGVRLPPRVVQDLMNTGRLEMYDTGLFDEPQSYGWKS